jgi:muramidase (phage lysozyme)
MDKTVPAGAAMLLAFIGYIEAPKGYGTIYGNNQDKLPKPLTSMTLGDVVDAQATWTKRFKSSAAGRYQFMRATLQDLSKELGLRGNQLFEPDFQDRLGYHLLKRRGYDAFMAGKISRSEFGKGLAQEWASLPVLAACQGAHLKLKRGQSYYCGDALNKSLVAPERVEAVLDEVKAAKSDIGIPISDKPQPLAKSKRFWTWVMTGIGAPLAAFGALDWRVQFFIVAVIVGFAIYAISAMPQVRKALGLS